jgi:hypothetical protein
LTCAAFPDGSLKPGNYASRACPFAPDRPHAPKTLRAKGDKKRRRETREDFSRKEKYMRFAASRTSRRRRQPVSLTSPGPSSGTRAARRRCPRSCLRPPQRQAAAARGSFPGYPTLGTTYATAAAAPVAAPIPRPSRHQPLPPATLPGTSAPH